MDTKKYLKINNRTKVLNSLVNFSEPLDLLSNQLKKLSWDYDGLPIVLKAKHLLAVLNNCVSGKITVGEVEYWANLIECREDIDYEEKNQEKIMDTIFRLANPDLEGKLNIEVLIVLINNLDNKL